MLFYLPNYCSYWSNPNKIDNIGHLNQMENSLRESIKGILLKKVSFRFPNTMLG